MPEPISIATACIGLVGTSAKAIETVTSFVSSVKSARKDMDAVVRELVSLQVSATVLKVDDREDRIHFPPEMASHLRQILVNCDMIMQQMNDTLLRLQSGRLGRRIQWTLAEREPMNKLRSSLESNKTALDIALSAGSVRYLVAQKQQLTSIAAQNNAIAMTMDQINNRISSLSIVQRDTSEINQEVKTLKLQLATLKTSSDGQKQMLQVFMEQSRNFAESSIASLTALSTTAQTTGVRPLLHVESLNLVDSGLPSIEDVRCPLHRTNGSILESGDALLCPYCVDDATYKLRGREITQTQEEIEHLQDELERLTAEYKHESMQAKAQLSQASAVEKKLRAELIQARLELRENNQSHSMGNRSSSISASGHSHQRPWLINAADKAQWDKQFEAIDTSKQNFIIKDQALPFFLNSRLSEESLQRIWNLADIDSDGRLNREEFALAMYLIRQARGTVNRYIPTNLPEDLHPPSMREAVEATSERNLRVARKETSSSSLPPSLVELQKAVQEQEREIIVLRDELNSNTARYEQELELAAIELSQQTSVEVGLQNGLEQARRELAVLRALALSTNTKLQYVIRKQKPEAALIAKKQPWGWFSVSHVPQRGMLGHEVYFKPVGMPDTEWESTISNSALLGRFLEISRSSKSMSSHERKQCEIDYLRNNVNEAIPLIKMKLVSFPADFKETLRFMFSAWAISHVGPNTGACLFMPEAAVKLYMGDLRFKMAREREFASRAISRSTTVAVLKTYLLELLTTQTQFPQRMLANRTIHLQHKSSQLLDHYTLGEDWLGSGETIWLMLKDKDSTAVELKDPEDSKHPPLSLLRFDDINQWSLPAKSEVTNWDELPCFPVQAYVLPQAEQASS